MKKLRLLVTKKCNNSCEGCCNKEWDLDNLEECDSFEDYDEILITGGEPLLFKEELLSLICQIRETSNAKVYVYTSIFSANNRANADINDIINASDGITLTLHNAMDENIFYSCADLITYDPTKSYRLNVFKGVEMRPINHMWLLRYGIEWIKDCPLPKGEVFKRLPVLWD